MNDLAQVSRNNVAGLYFDTLNVRYLYGVVPRYGSNMAGRLQGLVAEKVSEDEAYRMKDKLQAAPRRRGNAEGCGGEGRAPQQAEATPRGDTGTAGASARATVLACNRSLSI